MAAYVTTHEGCGMARRMIALAMWAYLGWYVASFLTVWMELPASLAPAGGVVMAALALVDWRRPVARALRPPRDEIPVNE
jgi:hypothetical protein